MAIETDIEFYLNTENCAVETLIDKRLYFMVSKQLEFFPQIVYYYASNPDQHNFVGIDGSNPIISFQIKADTYSSMIAVSEALRSMLNNFSGYLKYIPEVPADPGDPDADPVIPATPKIDAVYGQEIIRIRHISSKDQFDQDEYFLRTDDYQIEYKR